MNTKKLELIGLVSLAVFSIAAVGVMTASRTGNGGADAQINLLASTSLIQNAQASPIEHADGVKQKVVVAREQAPIYIDLGARF